MRINKLMILLAACFLSAFSASASSPGMTSKDMYAQFRNPDSRYRPFVRWWWNGDRVQAEELVRELHLLKDAGIGGVEINPIALPYGSDTTGTKALVWLSDEWISMLKTVFDEAAKTGMRCDLLVGSGWPFGSETLPMDERASVMLTYALDVKGGTTFQMSKYNIFKAIDPGVTKVNPSRNPELVSMYLVPNPVKDLSQAINITDKFVNNVITVDIPKGNYTIYALVHYDSFACVINGAPGAAGSILNHMDAKAVRNYLDHMSNTIEAQLGPLSKYLRAYFVDSMELEGCNWTSDFAAEFRKRRGYDILPWLPFTMFQVGRLGDAKSFEYGAKKSKEFQEQVNRVRFDFELTKAELLNERYTDTFLKWCRDQEVKSRAQAYGRGFFPLQSSMGYDIPEGESWTTNWLKHRIGEEMGDKDYRRGRAYTMIDKYVSSAAHLTGKRLVSAEEMTNTYKVFNTSLELLKVGSDMTAITGITHSVWHGFNYMPKDAAFPGWVQYGSYYNENNTWWPYFRLLNDYRARMSSILQNSDMFTDIAILPANYDMWTTMGVQTEPFPVQLNIPYTSLIWEAIHKNGGGADYVNEIVINNSVVRDGKLCYGPKKYGTIFLVEETGIMSGTLEKLLEFVRTGGRVFCIGKYPEKSLGLFDYQVRDKRILSLVDELKEYPDNFILLDKPSDGKYLEWYKGVMEKYSLPHAITITNPDRFLLQSHFVSDDKSDIFLFENANMSEARTTDILFPKSVTAGRKAWLYNPADGKRYSLPVKNGRLHFEFGPSETYLFVFNKLRGKAPLWKTLPVSGKDSVMVDNWKLTLRQAQKDTVMYTEMAELKDLKDTEFKNFMGTVTYVANVNLKKTEMPEYINLGKVCDICELKVNGVYAGTRWFGRSIFDVSSLLKAGDNTIEVKVTTLMGNYLWTLKDNKVAKRFVINRKQAMVSMGLLGPVKLYK